MHNLLIFGGTFDPIHNGHIKIAENVQQHFNFDEFIFLPCKIPLLKNQCIATPKQRLTMLELALKNISTSTSNCTFKFKIDKREINRDSPSYMVNTLIDFRNEVGDSMPLTLLMGEDTFGNIPQWYKWESLIKLTNFLVVRRPTMSQQLAPTLNSLLSSHETHDHQKLRTEPCGYIFQFNAGAYNLSSSYIRGQLMNAPLANALPESVENYIKKHNLYR